MDVALANKIANQLMTDLKSGKLKSIGIDQIEEAIRTEVAHINISPRRNDILVDMVCRKVINLTTT